MCTKLSILGGSLVVLIASNWVTYLRPLRETRSRVIKLSYTWLLLLMLKILHDFTPPYFLEFVYTKSCRSHIGLQSVWASGSSQAQVHLKLSPKTRGLQVDRKLTIILMRTSKEGP